ncbi:MAG TPA: hypothetical protein VMS55_06870 [Myxococcota bacterium]|nr:hypothetical protein [Myxococcota bacterium]
MPAAVLSGSPRRGDDGSSKSTYLRVEQGDTAAAPLAISLAGIGAQPGDRLHLAPAGTDSDLNVLKDGTETRLIG